MFEMMHAWIQLDLTTIIKAGGYFGLAAIVFSESGVLLGMFLPGDSLLFIAGLLAATGFFDLGPLVVTIVVAAILGDSFGYWFGRRVGASLFTREDSRFFKKEYVTRTQDFYRQYGGRALILARFVPIVRTLAPILAGVGMMEYRKFVSYNAVGGLLWGAGMVLLGYFLGSIIPDSEHYILPVSLVIIFLSFVPVFLNHYKTKRATSAPETIIPNEY